jgi:hypothetical protein
VTPSPLPHWLLVTSFGDTLKKAAIIDIDVCINGGSEKVKKLG